MTESMVRSQANKVAIDRIAMDLETHVVRYCSRKASIGE